MLAGLSTAYMRSGSSRSASRLRNILGDKQVGGLPRFVAMTETALAELLDTNLSGLDWVALMIDGVHFAESCCIVALGIGIDGSSTAGVWWRVTRTRRWSPTCCGPA